MSPVDLAYIAAVAIMIAAGTAGLAILIVRLIEIGWH